MAAKNWLIHLMKPGLPPPTARPVAIKTTPATPRRLPNYIQPMLAMTGSKRDLGEGERAFTMHRDGIRAFVPVGAGEVRHMTRNGHHRAAA